MKRKIFITLLVLLIICAAIIFYCNYVIERSSEGKLYSSTNDIPYNKVGLLLGTGKFLQNGFENPYYTYRIIAAEELIKSGKIKYLIISGDNSRQDYNEPQQMKESLIQRGIDSNK